MSKKFRRYKCVFLSLAAFVFAYLTIVPLAISEKGILNNKSYEYQKRGKGKTERYEGIKPEQIAGEYLELLSFVADYQQNSPDNPDEIKEFNLGFYLEHDATVHVTVKEYSKGYVMEPINTKWKKGFNVFSWDVKLIKKLNIELYELEAKAIENNEDLRSVILIPVVLFYSYNKLPKKIEPVYEFHIVSSDKVDLIINDKQCLKDQHPKQIIPIEWKYKGEKQCQLKLDAVFLNPVTKIKKKIPYSYKFNHEILTQSENESLPIR